MLTIENIVANATLDSDQVEFLYNNVLNAWNDEDTTKIRILEAPMNSGKTTTMLMATVWAEVCNNPSRNLILYVAPRKELIADALKKVKLHFEDKIISCSDDTVKSVSVYDQEWFSKYLTFNKVDKKTNFTIPADEIIFTAVSIQWLSDAKNLDNVLKLNPGFIYADEPHIGLKIADADSMITDAGRYPPSDYDPVWLPAMMALAQAGHKVLGSTATTSESQAGKTASGKTKFLALPIMPKRDFKACFPVLHPNPSVYSAYEDFKKFWPAHLKKTKKLIDAISRDTWSKAAAIGIVPSMPLYFVKAGAENAQRSIPFFVYSRKLKDSLYDDLWNFNRGLDSAEGIFAINTSNHIELAKKNNVNYKRQHVKGLNDIMDVLNDPSYNMYSGGLGVINTGTAGMNVHRLDTVVYLSDPENLSDIADSQIQTLGRIMRFPFLGMRSHADMREKIDGLDISLNEKYLLCEYVVYKCLNHIFYMDSQLMNIAVNEFCESTMTEEGGIEYYMSHMSTDTPHHTPAPTPSVGMSYDASALNRTYKKDHCECCTVIDDIGTTVCEENARNHLEQMAGAMDDTDWNDLWLKVLHLHHKDVNHFNYDPSNLITLCPNMHMAITIFEEHALNRY